MAKQTIFSSLLKAKCATLENNTQPKELQGCVTNDTALILHSDVMLKL